MSTTGRGHMSHQTGSSCLPLRSVYRSIPETAGIFATYPSPHLSMAGGAFDQFLGTMLLLLCICAITDPRNMKLDKQVMLASGWLVS